MSKPHQYILILWAVGFDEAAASIFVTELRQAGRQVKVISLTRQQTRGAHGLALVPDLTLSQALPLLSQTSHLIIPADSLHLHRLANDPSLVDFLEQVRGHEISILLQPGGDGPEAGACDLAGTAGYYPAATAELVEFVQEIGLRRN